MCVVIPPLSECSRASSSRKDPEQLAGDLDSAKTGFSDSQTSGLSVYEQFPQITTCVVNLSDGKQTAWKWTRELKLQTCLVSSTDWTVCMWLYLRISCNMPHAWEGNKDPQATSLLPVLQLVSEVGFWSFAFGCHPVDHQLHYNWVSERLGILEVWRMPSSWIRAALGP